MESMKRPPPVLTTRNDNGSSAEQEEEVVSPAGLLFRQPRFDCYIIAMLGIGKPIDVATIKAGLVETILRHPRFSSVQVSADRGGEKLRWVRTNVAVDDHVIVPDIRQSAVASSPDEAVEDYVSSLTATPMSSSRPLWELHLLNIPTSQAAAVAVFRIHHSLGDGASLISLLLACTRRTADPTSLPVLPEPRQLPASRPRPNALLAALLYLGAVIVLTWNTAVDFFFLLATSAWLKDTPTPLKGGERVEFHRNRFVHRTVSLDDVKDIKNCMNCSLAKAGSALQTVNDVLIGVTSAGLSRYLNRRYGEKWKEKQLPAKIRLRSAMLINIRPSLGIQALAEMMDGKNCGLKWGNLLSYILLPFPIVMHSDPLDYVRTGKAIADRKKNSLQAVIAYRCGKLFVNKFGVKGAAALTYRFVCNTTLSYSNIVGPVDEVGFYGHPIVYIAPSVYGHPHALTLHYQSYMNTMKIVIGVDELTIPDPHCLLDDLAESLKLIKEAIPVRK